MRSEEQVCQVCKCKTWNNIGVLTSGIWDKSQPELQRDELVLPIGECGHCGHVQMTTVYNEEIFEKLYFSDVREPSMFVIPKDNELSPYEQMIDFFKNELIEGGNIADFGCGAGNIFKEIKKNQSLPKVMMTGVDFKPVITDPSINAISWDLNSEEDMPKDFWPNGIDLAISTHVLEHVVNPVAFLNTIHKQLSENGKVFIEVPDCSPNTDLSNIAFTNVVHGQHIHYFSEESLALVAQQAGFDVVKSKQLMTRTTPRLLAILKKNTEDGAIRKVARNAVKVVGQQLLEMKTQHQSLAVQILNCIEKHGKAGLWGIGGDAYSLLKSHPELVQALADNKLELFDYDLVGHTYMGKPVQSSIELESRDMMVFMVPLFAPTREKMRLASEDWLSTAIESY